eukprot:m.180902 g.180902  ORF g.180902 m.180902 type:complete len:101 (+) comp25434_c1_seq5:589-891(+)
MALAKGENKEGTATLILRFVYAYLLSLSFFYLVWGTPTTALWASRVGVQQAKRLLFTGDLIDGQKKGDSFFSHLFSSSFLSVFITRLSFQGKKLKNLGWH